MEGAHPEKAGRKQRILHELRELAAIFLYLAAFFVVLRTYTHLALLDRQIAYDRIRVSTLGGIALGLQGARG